MTHPDGAIDRPSGSGDCAGALRRPSTAPVRRKIMLRPVASGQAGPALAGADRVGGVSFPRPRGTIRFGFGLVLVWFWCPDLGLCHIVHTAANSVEINRAAIAGGTDGGRDGGRAVGGRAGRESGGRGCGSGGGETAGGGGGGGGGGAAGDGRSDRGTEKRRGRRDRGREGEWVAPCCVCELDGRPAEFARTQPGAV